MYCHFEMFAERQNFRRTTVRRRTRTKPDGPDLKLFGAKSCCSQFQEESENLERINLYFKSWGWQLSFFHSFIFIFANNAKIHDRLLYWAPLTYKTKNKHTLHSMIHTNTFFLKSDWGVTSLEFIFSRFCFGFVIGCNISLEILGSKGFNFFIIVSSLTWKVKFCIIKNQSIFLLITVRVEPLK